MKRKTKCLGLGLGLSLLCLPMVSTVTQAASEAEILLNGEVNALILDFKVPSTLEFAIDPNATSTDQVFISPSFVVKNDSGAPLGLSISTFQNNGGHLFTDVLPETHSDWTLLGATESMRDIALGLDIDPESDNTWYPTSGAATNTIYAKTVQDTPAPIFIGGIHPNSEVKLGLTAHHGYSFSSPLSTQYRMTFIFELL